MKEYQTGHQEDEIHMLNVFFLIKKINLLISYCSVNVKQSVPIIANAGVITK
jgi:hypothetical protein